MNHVSNYLRKFHDKSLFVMEAGTYVNTPGCMEHMLPLQTDWACFIGEETFPCMLVSLLSHLYQRYSRKSKVNVTWQVVPIAPPPGRFRHLDAGIHHM